MSNELMVAPMPGADVDAMSRQEAARQACEAAGITWPGTILPPGTALYSSGVEKLKADRQNWRRLPLAAEVIGLVETALAAEKRMDFTVGVGDLVLRGSNGRIYRADSTGNPAAVGLAYDDHSLRQLVAQITPFDSAPRGFASALLYLSDRERAEIINKRLELVAKNEDQTQVVLRTKLPHVSDGMSRVLRATLSEVYGSVTDEDIAKALGAILRDSGDGSGRLDYKPGDSHSRFEVIWPSEIPVETYVVGDVHYAAICIHNSETGEGGIHICPAVIRARCANLTTSVGHGIEVNIRHVGDPQKLMFRLVKAIRAAIDDLEPLLHVISASARIPLPSAWSPEKAFAEIARRYAQPKMVVPTWKAMLTEGNYPETVWGLAASIQEAAHRRTETWGQGSEWERVAGQVQAKAVEVVRAGTPAARALDEDEEGEDCPKCDASLLRLHQDGETIYCDALNCGFETSRFDVRHEPDCALLKLRAEIATVLGRGRP